MAESTTQQLIDEEKSDQTKIKRQQNKKKTAIGTKRKSITGSRILSRVSNDLNQLRTATVERLTPAQKKKRMAFKLLRYIQMFMCAIGMVIAFTTYIYVSCDYDLFKSTINESALIRVLIPETYKKVMKLNDGKSYMMAMLSFQVFSFILGVYVSIYSLAIGQIFHILLSIPFSTSIYGLLYLIMSTCFCMMMFMGWNGRDRIAIAIQLE